MNVLFITDITTFPVNAGEKIRSLGLIKLFNKIAKKQMVICPISNEDVFSEFSKQENLSRTTFINYTHEKKNKFKKLTQHFQKSDELLQIINSLINEYSIDYCILDYGYQGQYIEYFTSRGIQVVYGTHNSQASLTLQMPTNTMINTLQKYILYAFQYFHERLYFNKANFVIVVSENDRQYHKMFIDEIKLITIPNFLDAEKYKNVNINSNKEDDYIIMSASFTAYQNIVGLEWFLNNVWNQELSNNLKFYIVGKGSEGILKSLNIKNIKNVYEIGTVDDMLPYIKNAKLSVIPLLHGSGTRLKCLEAMALKTIIVGTSRGIEGINHEGSIIVTDDPKIFRQEIIKILSDTNEAEKLKTEAYNIFVKKYSLESNINEIKKFIN